MTTQLLNSTAPKMTSKIAVGLQYMKRQPLLNMWVQFEEASVSQQWADTLHICRGHTLLDVSSFCGISQAPACSWSSMPRGKRYLTPLNIPKTGLITDQAEWSQFRDVWCLHQICRDQCQMLWNSTHPAQHPEFQQGNWQLTRRCLCNAGYAEKL